MLSRKWLGVMMMFLVVMTWQQVTYGQELVVTAQDPGDDEVASGYYMFRVTEDGEHAKIQYSEDTNYRVPRLSADGEQVIYSLVDHSLFLTDRNGEQAKLLTKLDNGGGYDWYPDGERIMIGSDHTLVSYDLATGETEELYKNEGLKIRSIAVSPSGTKVAFSQFVGAKGLYVYDLESGELKQVLADDKAYLSHAQWSPDESELVYAYHKKGFFSETMEIRILDLATGESETIVEELAKQVYDISWSVEKNEIAFVSEFAKNKEWNVYLIQPDGLNLRILKSTEASETGVDW